MERNVLDSIVMCAVKSFWCMYCFHFWLSYAKAELSVPCFPPQHMRKPWAQCEHAVISMQIALYGLSSGCTQSIFFKCLPCSLCWGGGRTSKAVRGRDQKPHLVTGGGVMCWWDWCQGGKVFCCLSTILTPTHSSRNSQSLLLSIIKAARNFLLLLQFPPVQNNLPLGEHPWRFNIKSALAPELWYLPVPSSLIPVL